VLLCGIGLPIDPVDGDLNGIRLGTQEITRWGLEPGEMPAIARFIARVFRGNEDPAALRPEVIEFRRGFQRLRFVR
jgi:glycine hydroxymethyltransferase